METKHRNTMHVSRKSPGRPADQQNDLLIDDGEFPTRLHSLQPGTYQNLLSSQSFNNPAADLITHQKTTSSATSQVSYTKSQANNNQNNNSKLLGSGSQSGNQQQHHGSKRRQSIAVNVISHVVKKSTLSVFSKHNRSPHHHRERRHSSRQLKDTSPKDPEPSDVQLRLLNKIALDQKEHIEKDMTPAQLMAMYHPVPQRGGSLEKKFTYFFKPYTYSVNTQKFMKFEEDPTPEVLEEARALAPCWRNFEQTPWTQSRPESWVVHARAVDEFTKDIDDCQSWRDVHNFMFSGDQRTFVFVLNQLMRMLGVKRKKKKDKKNKQLQNQMDRTLHLFAKTIRIKNTLINTQFSQHGNSDDNKSESSFKKTGSHHKRTKRHKQRSRQEKSNPNDFAVNDRQDHNVVARTSSMPIQETKQNDNACKRTSILDAIGLNTIMLANDAAQKTAQSASINLTQSSQQHIIEETIREHTSSSSDENRDVTPKASSSRQSHARQSRAPKLALNLIGVGNIDSLTNSLIESQQESSAADDSSSGYDNSGQQSGRQKKLEEPKMRKNVSKKSTQRLVRKKSSKQPKNSARKNKSQLKSQYDRKLSQMSEALNDDSKLDQQEKAVVAAEPSDSVDSDNYASDSSCSDKGRKSGALRRNMKNQNTSFKSTKTNKTKLMNKALPNLAQRLANAIKAKISIALANYKRRAISHDAALPMDWFGIQKAQNEMINLHVQSGTSIHVASGIASQDFTEASRKESGQTQLNQQMIKGQTLTAPLTSKSMSKSPSARQVVKRVVTMKKKFKVGFKSAANNLDDTQQSKRLPNFRRRGSLKRTQKQKQDAMITNARAIKKQDTLQPVDPFKFNFGTVNKQSQEKSTPHSSQIDSSIKGFKRIDNDQVIENSTSTPVTKDLQMIKSQSTIRKIMTMPLEEQRSNKDRIVPTTEDDQAQLSKLGSNLKKEVNSPKSKDAQSFDDQRKKPSQVADIYSQMAQQQMSKQMDNTTPDNLTVSQLPLDLDQEILAEREIKEQDSTPTVSEQQQLQQQETSQKREEQEFSKTDNQDKTQNEVMTCKCLSQSLSYLDTLISKDASTTSPPLPQEAYQTYLTYQTIQPAQPNNPQTIQAPSTDFLRRRHQLAPALHDFTRLLGRRESNMSARDKLILQTRANKGVEPSWQEKKDNGGEQGVFGVNQQHLQIDCQSEVVVKQPAQLKTLLSSGQLQQQIKAKMSQTQTTLLSPTQSTIKKSSLKISSASIKKATKVLNPKSFINQCKEIPLVDPSRRQSSYLYSPNVPYSPTVLNRRSQISTQVSSKLQPIIDQYLSIKSQTFKIAQQENCNKSQKTTPKESSRKKTSITFGQRKGFSQAPKSTTPLLKGFNNTEDKQCNDNSSNLRCQGEQHNQMFLDSSLGGRMSELRQQYSQTVVQQSTPKEMTRQFNITTDQTTIQKRTLGGHKSSQQNYFYLGDNPNVISRLSRNTFRTTRKDSSPFISRHHLICTRNNNSDLVDQTETNETIQTPNTNRQVGTQLQSSRHMPSKFFHQRTKSATLNRRPFAAQTTKTETNATTLLLNHHRMTTTSPHLQVQQINHTSTNDADSQQQLLQFKERKKFIATQLAASSFASIHNKDIE